MTRRTKPLRADAARNRDRLVAAAGETFAQYGLHATLEEIARRAEVSIGTLYNHFPTRADLLDAVFPDRLDALGDLAETALTDPDAWNGFVGFLYGLFALKAQDRGLNDALGEGPPPSPEIQAACHRGLQHVDRIIRRAKDSGQLRTDFEVADLPALFWAMSQVIRESIDQTPDAWQRHLAFFLDGLRTDAGHPNPVPATEPAQFDRIIGRASG